MASETEEKDKPLGTRQAFPQAICGENFRGMTYRQWLVGQALPEALRQGRIVTSPNKDAAELAFYNDVAEKAVRAADAVLLLLEVEKVSDKFEENKPDAEAP